MRFGHHLLLILGLTASLSAQTPDRLNLGRLQSGATVSFTRSSSGEWGVEIAGGPAPRISQPKPAKLEVFTAELDVHQLAAGYTKVQKSAGGIDALAEIGYGDTAKFRV